MPDYRQPMRIQRRRTKGWRMPEGAVNVTRPSRWGNPFPVQEYGLDLSLELFGEAMRGVWNPFLLQHLSDAEYRKTADQRERFSVRIGGCPAEMARTELRGRDLACWCSTLQPCHADILLKVANA